MVSVTAGQTPAGSFVVNVRVITPAVLSAPTREPGNPDIERLLTRPTDLWERLRQGFSIPDVDAKLVAQRMMGYTDIDTPLLNKRPVVPDATARAKMMKAEDIADCALLAINLPPRAVVEEILVRPG